MIGLNRLNIRDESLTSISSNRSLRSMKKSSPPPFRPLISVTNKRHVSCSESQRSGRNIPQFEHVIAPSVNQLVYLVATGQFIALPNVLYQTSQRAHTSLHELCDAVQMQRPMTCNNLVFSSRMRTSHFQSR